MLLRFLCSGALYLFFDFFWFLSVSSSFRRVFLPTWRFVWCQRWGKKCNVQPNCLSITVPKCELPVVPCVSVPMREVLDRYSNRLYWTIWDKLAIHGFYGRGKCFHRDHCHDSEWVALEVKISNLASFNSGYFDVYPDLNTNSLTTNKPTCSWTPIRNSPVCELDLTGKAWTRRECFP